MNIGLVLLFNFAIGVMISPALLFYGQRQPGLIGQAAVLTIGAFGILTLYAFVSRRDFSPWGSFLMVGLWVLIGTMLLNLFFQNAAVDLWLASVTVLLFSGLLVYDTWRLRNFYGPDEYVGAAVQIYLDLLNIFMAVLRVLGNRRN
jgi:FtsH-binding integral membrane protein